MASAEDPATTAEDEDLTLTIIAELEDKTALEDIGDVKGHNNKNPCSCEALQRLFGDLLSREKCPHCDRKQSALL